MLQPDARKLFGHSVILVYPVQELQRVDAKLSEQGRDEIIWKWNFPPAFQCLKPDNPIFTGFPKFDNISGPRLDLGFG